MLAFCLHEVQGDRFADELEDPPLGGGGLGELVERHVRSRDGASAAGEGLQVLAEALVGPDGLASLVCLVGGFGPGRRRREHEADRVDPFWLWPTHGVGEGEWCNSTTQTPGKPASQQRSTCPRTRFPVQ